MLSTYQIIERSARMYQPQPSIYNTPALSVCGRPTLAELAERTPAAVAERLSNVYLAETKLHMTIGRIQSLNSLFLH